MAAGPLNIQEILLTEEQIQAKVTEMGVRITRDYDGKELVLICVLRGGLVFTADLMRKIELPVTLDFVHASSYGAGTDPRQVMIKKDIETDIRGKHVLIVDCIIDTGETLDYLLKRYRTLGPASVNAVVLLDKKPRRRVTVPIAYAGFPIPDRFVVGYGVDCAEQFRNLPWVAALAPQD
jgi:hypoxanthine phosphoribosyltransferase